MDAHSICREILIATGKPVDLRKRQKDQRICRNDGWKGWLFYLFDFQLEMQSRMARFE